MRKEREEGEMSERERESEEVGDMRRERRMELEKVRERGTPSNYPFL